MGGRAGSVEGDVCDLRSFSETDYFREAHRVTSPLLGLPLRYGNAGIQGVFCSQGLELGLVARLPRGVFPAVSLACITQTRQGSMFQFCSGTARIQHS